MFESSALKHRTYCGCSSRPHVNVTPTPIPILLCLTTQSMLSREYSHTASYLLHLLPSPPVSLPSCVPPHTHPPIPSSSSLTLGEPLSPPAGKHMLLFSSDSCVSVEDSSMFINHLSETALENRVCRPDHSPPAAGS